MQTTIVNTQNGKIQGTTENDVCVWRGVRYAKPPKGELRFRAPQPLECWLDVKEATHFRATAPQPINEFTKSFKMPPEPTDEDCLFLNIWSPAADDKKRPVMFWIHGGAYTTGSGSMLLYNGSHLARSGDVVVVTINYRLGPLGFLYFKGLNTDTHAFDTNVGIRDQIAALCWVKGNIAAFGGDPNQITIFGESAGGSSVVTLLGTPSARGLFQRAIAESAPANSIYDSHTASEVAKKYVSILGIAPADIGKLRSMPIDELIGATNPLAAHVAMTIPGNIAFQPTIDGDLLPQHPMKAIAAGSAKDIPLMLGTNHDEASIFAMMHPPSLPTTPERIHALFQRTDIAAEARVTAAYPHFPAKSARLAFGGDVTFRIPSIRVAEAQSQYAPTWIYRFDWASWLMKARGLGAFHALELAFVFDTLDTSLGKLITALTRKHLAQSLSQRMHRAWLNFARTGNPNAAGQKEWLNYDTPKRATMIFDSKDHLEFDPEAEQRQAWEGVNC